MQRNYAESKQHAQQDFFFVYKCLDGNIKRFFLKYKDKKVRLWPTKELNIDAYAHNCWQESKQYVQQDFFVYKCLDGNILFEIKGQKN